MKRKLAILIHSLARGGTERVVSILANQLHKEFELTLVMLERVIEYEIADEVNIHILNKGKRVSSFQKLLEILPFSRKYAAWCKNNAIDVSYSLLERPNFINISSKRWGNPATILIGERCTPSQIYNKGSIKDRIVRYLIRKLYQHADAILPNSKGVAADLINQFGIPSGKVKIVSNPIDIKSLNGEQTPIDIEKKGFTFICVANLIEYKNHHLLLESFKALNDPSCFLWLIGKGPLENQLRHFIEENGMEEKIEILGFQKSPFKYVRAADCFVLPSNTEGFPNVLIEALANGLPVIATDCKSGPREIIAPDTDVNFQLKDAIEMTTYGILSPVKSVENLTKAMRRMVEEKDKKYHNPLVFRERVKEYDSTLILERYKKIFNQN